MPYFSDKLQLIIVLLSIRDPYMSWSGRFVSLKLFVGFSIFHSVSFLLKFIFLFTKFIDSLTLKRHNSFQNKNNKKSTHSLAPRPLIFQLEQEILKFNDVYISWKIPKTGLETRFLNLENRSFENIFFSQ